MTWRVTRIVGPFIHVGLTVWLVRLLMRDLRHRGRGPLPIPQFVGVSVWIFVVVGCILVLLWLALTVNREDLLATASRAWRRRRRPAGAPWSRTLLVDADLEGGSFAPSVWISGGRAQRGARVRLRLLDDAGVVRAACEAPLPAALRGAELRLPALVLPAGSSTTEALAWQWELSVHSRWRLQARWQEPLLAAHKTNAEGELLEVPGLVEAPVPAEAPHGTLAAAPSPSPPPAR